MASRNGTFINKERITASELRHHDQIAFGDQSFLFLRQSANKKERKRDGLREVAVPITLSGEEIDPSSLYACATDQARLTLSPTEDRQGLRGADSAGRFAQDPPRPRAVNYASSPKKVWAPP